METLNAYSTYTSDSESSEYTSFDSGAFTDTTDFDAEYTSSEVSFDALYEEHKIFVHNVIRRIVGTEDAEDVAQIAWVKVWKGGKTFRGESKISSWLYRIAQNAAISHLRARGARIQTEPLEDDDYVYADSEHPDAQLGRREQRSELARRIRQLSEIHREALLASLDDTTLETRSLRLGVSMRTLKTTTWRARQIVTTT